MVKTKLFWVLQLFYYILSTVCTYVYNTPCILSTILQHKLTMSLGTMLSYISVICINRLQVNGSHENFLVYEEVLQYELTVSFLKLRM